MKPKIILITVMLAMSFTKVASATNPIPQEIAEQLKTDGYVISYREVLYDFDLKHII